MPAWNIKMLTLRNKLAILSFASVVLAMAIGGMILAVKITHILEEEMGMRVLAIARTLAQMEEIQSNVGKTGGHTVIQPIAEKTRLATGVEYIVVVDMNRVRYSHPVSDRIGKQFTESDLNAALANHEYTSRAIGVLGPSIRAFVPIKVDEGNRQVGVVIVGILTPAFSALSKMIYVQISSALIVCLLVGLLGALYLADRIKKAMFSMEPEEIARLLEERTAIFQAMGEGIIAIDRHNKITVANEEARRILGAGKEITGLPICEVLPETYLPRVLQSGKAEINQERVINDTVIITSRVPIKYKGEIVGAVATFRDKSDVHRLAEELTGVKLYVEALRVQNHEYMNKLHTIAGLIQLDKSEQALDYIFAETEAKQELTRTLTRNICNYSIAGLILGKYSRAKELKINLNIDKNCILRAFPKRLDSAALAVILGNLLENAMDAVKDMDDSRKKIYFAIFDTGDLLTIKVEDCGCGISSSLREQIFEQGFSTKGVQGHGIGLYLVKRHVDNAGGCIYVEEREQGGTCFKVIIPKIIV